MKTKCVWVFQSITEEVEPPKPRPMWMEGDGVDVRKVPKRRTTLDSLGLQNEDNESSGVLNFFV